MKPSQPAHSASANHPNSDDVSKSAAECSVPDVQFRRLRKVVGAEALELIYAEPKVAYHQVSQVTGLLYRQFEFLQGEIRLAGCHLLNRLLLVFCEVQIEATLPDAETKVALKPNLKLKRIAGVNDDGQRWFSDHEIDSLDLSQKMESLINSLGDISKGPAEQISDASPKEQREFEIAFQQIDQTHMLSANLILAMPMQWIEGKFEFVYQGQSVECPFSGWADRLSKNPALCQPYYCPMTQVSGKVISVDDEGDISVANAMQTCTQTGKRLLTSKLFQCENSGRWAARSKMIFASDGISGMLPQYVSQCRQCGLPVTKKKLGPKMICKECQMLCDAQLVSEPEDLLRLQRLLPILELENLLSEGTQWRLVRNRDLTWLMATSSHSKVLKQTQLFVFDGSDQLIAHRKKNTWTGRWNAANGKS